MACVEKELERASVTTFGRLSRRQIMTVSDIAEDREQWRELLALAAMTESTNRNRVTDLDSNGLLFQYRVPLKKNDDDDDDDDDDETGLTEAGA